MFNIRNLFIHYLRNMRYQILDRKIIVFKKDGSVHSSHPSTVRSIQKIVTSSCWDRSISSIIIQVTYIDSERDEAFLPLVLVIVIKASVHSPILT